MNLLFATAILATILAVDKPAEMKHSNLRVMPVERTPESSSISLNLVLPGEGVMLNKNPVWIQFRIDGYSLGSNSPSDRGKEIVQSDMGQTIHVVIDDNFYFPVNEPALDPFEAEGNYYYDMSYKFELPFKLKQGKHIIRMFPARSYGESLKGENTFRASYFYLGNETIHSDMELSQPYLTYNEPSNQMYLVESKPVLLDFYLSNCELSPDGYKVRFSVDGKNISTLTTWQPFYIYGLKKGPHTIRLELLDQEDKVVPGSFNDVHQAITIH